VGLTVAGCAEIERTDEALARRRQGELALGANVMYGLAQEDKGRWEAAHGVCRRATVSGAKDVAGGQHAQHIALTLSLFAPVLGTDLRNESASARLAGAEPAAAARAGLTRGGRYGTFVPAQGAKQGERNV